MWSEQSGRTRSGRAAPLLAFVVCLCKVPLVVAPASAQAPEGAVPAAERLREAGDFEGAAAVLRAELDLRPENGDAARLLAQTLYWAQDVDGAVAGGPYRGRVGRVG